MPKNMAPFEPVEVSFMNTNYIEPEKKIIHVSSKELSTTRMPRNWAL